VQIFGAKDYAMRIWLRPDRLAQLKLTTTDVLRAINEQNAQFAAGKVGQPPSASKEQELVYTVTTAGGWRSRRSSRRSSCAPTPTARGAAEGRGAGRAGQQGLRLHRPLQRQERHAGRHLPAAGRQRARRRTDGARPMERALQALPAGAGTYAIPYDTTRFVEVSIREVVKTLGEAMLLVFLVVSCSCRTGARR
jgi:multidrug efflux pump subunit AcrB